MKNKRSLILLLFLLIGLYACNNNAVPQGNSESETAAPVTNAPTKTDIAGEYQFEVNEDDTITIIKYTGKSASVTIPAEINGKRVTAIGNTFGEKGAFAGCTELRTLVILDGVVEIRDNAFQGCDNLIAVTIPASVTLLRNGAFNDCFNLHSVYFEGSAPEMGNNIFSSTSEYFTIYYPKSAKGWTSPWYGCNSEPMPEIYEEPAKIEILSGDYQYQIGEDNTITITRYMGEGGDVKIPAEIDGKKVTAIGNAFKETGAFAECETLTSVIIPNGVTEIQDNAFMSCRNLTTATIPASVEYLLNCAFADCLNLQSVYFEGDAPETGNYVFSYSETVTLTVYYHEGTTGWTNPWYGCPTETY